MKITQEPSPGTTAEAVGVATNRVTNQRVATQAAAKPAPTGSMGKKNPRRRILRRHRRPQGARRR